MNRKFPMHHKTLPSTIYRAKSLRRTQTPAENRFWYYVRNRKMLGLKFRRQHPLGNFIADFYCHELKLVVEIDGSIHELDHIKEYDKERETQIKKLGLSVLRFSNTDVFYNPDFVELTIKKFMDTKRGFGS